MLIWCLVDLRVLPEISYGNDNDAAIKALELSKGTRSSFINKVRYNNENISITSIDS